MQFYIYLHCKPDGSPFYVGKGKGNRAGVFSRRNHLHARIVKKYGIESIGVFVFPCASEDEAFADEIAHIAQLRADGFSLANLTDGGDGTSGYIKSDESKKRVSEALKGRPLSPERRAKIGEANRGKIRSDEFREAVARSLTGRPCTEETRKKLSEAHKGRTYSPETIAAMREGQRRRALKLTEEHKALLASFRNDPAVVAKRRQGLLGHVVSDETKAKLSEAAKRQWDRKRASEVLS